MKAKYRKTCAALLAAGAFTVALSWAHEIEKKEVEGPSKESAIEEGEKAGEGKADKLVLAEPKPITKEIEKGLKYLAHSQNDDGGWGQGGGWRVNTEASGRVEGAKAQDKSDVGNTCITMLAFLRAGENLRTSPHAERLRKGVDYVMKQVTRSGDTDLYVTTVRDTQLQSKIGRYVDTFLALQLLSELKDQMPDKARETQRSELVDKIVAKIEKNQQDNGAFAGNGGWAAVLSQGICSRALNGARLSGAKVSDVVLELDNRQNQDGLDVEGKAFTAPVAEGAPSTAGIQLYSTSSKLRGLQENWAVNRKRAEEFQKVVDSPTAPKEEKEKAQNELKKIADADKARDAAAEAVAQSVKSDQFVAGFGNNGGEEFLSYMNVSESLRLKGGQDWADWDKKITVTINGAQNEDGSWSGHHCITGRNFCTAGALLTLMADRAPAPDAQEAVAATE